MREIGGYLELETFSGEEYYTNCIALNTGRNALKYLIQAKNIQRIWLPCLLCDSAREVCIKNRIDICCYHIDEKMRPIIPELNANEYVYVVNYYGIMDTEEILQLHKKYPKIIVDQAHSFYQRPVPNIDYIYTCRKFFGVSDGAYLFTDKVLNQTLERDVSYRRISHILGRYEECASDHYAKFREVEDSFSNLELKEMSKLTRNLMRGIDYDAVYSKRRENFSILRKCFANMNLDIFDSYSGFFCYPLYHENGDRLRKKLQNYKIYIPTLWPNLQEEASEIERRYAENILPLPISQSYTDCDMEYMIKIIKELL